MQEDAATTYSMDLDWRFTRSDVPAASEPSFDDSAWEQVSLPHTFNDVDTFDNFMEHGHNGERSLYTGRTWYRKQFEVGEAERGNRFLLEFEGVRQAGQVHVNGVRVGPISENGFVPFAHDITDHVQVGLPNVLAVMVDNTFPYRAEGSGDVLSWHDSHWHPTHGGIWRNVHLHSRPPVHLTLPLYSFLQTQGTYVWSEITGADATLTVEAEVANTTGGDAEGTVAVSVTNADGIEVLTGTAPLAIEARGTAVATISGRLHDVITWEPHHPHLYRVTVQLDAAGARDQMVVEHGVRHGEFTADQGFFLNGHAAKLVGWGQRPTNEWAGLGAAFPDWMHAHIVGLMRGAGANLVRWGHAAGAPADITAADRLGLVTIQPGVDGEGSTVGGVYSEASYRIRLDAWRDTVIRYRNNPSILVWEAGNQSVPRAEAEALKAVVDRWDPHGGRAFAARRSDSVMADYVDLSIGTEGSWELRSRGLPVVEGEYNREEAPRRVWDRSTPGYEEFHTAPGSAYDLTSEDLAANQARHYRKIADRAHSGGANWIFSDSTSHGRVHSEVTRAGGAVDAVMLPKEAYWATAVIFDPSPRAHIIGHWNYPEATTKPVHVMARAASLELLLNGRSLGVVEPTDDFLFTFPAVTFEAGELRAVARDAVGRVVSQDAKVTTGEAVALRLTPLTRIGGAVASGADVIHVDVEAVDSLGRRVPLAEQRVTFDHQGPATWRGGYNSGREGSTNATYLDLEAGVNRVALRTQREAGTVTVRAAADGLIPAEVTLQVAPVEASGGLARPETVPVTILEPAAATGFGPGPDPTYVAPPDDRADSTLFGDLSYSGAGQFGGARSGLAIGDPIYSDEPDEFSLQHSFLLDTDYLLLPNADRDYKALDLIHVTLREDADVQVAHDDRLPRPAWLREGFTDGGTTIPVDGHTHTLFLRHCSAGETMTLGGNTDDTDAADGAQYLVVARAAGTGPRSTP